MVSMLFLLQSQVSFYKSVIISCRYGYILMNHVNELFTNITHLCILHTHVHAYIPINISSLHYTLGIKIFMYSQIYAIYYSY